MTVKRFWEEIGVSAAVSARADEVLRENEALFERSVCPQRARRMDVGLVVPPSARAQRVPPRRARIRDDGRGGVRRQAVGRR